MHQPGLYNIETIVGLSMCHRIQHANTIEQSLRIAFTHQREPMKRLAAESVRRLMRINCMQEPSPIMHISTSRLHTTETKS